MLVRVNGGAVALAPGASDDCLKFHPDSEEIEVPPGTTVVFSCVDDQGNRFKTHSPPAFARWAQGRTGVTVNCLPVQGA